MTWQQLRAAEITRLFWEARREEMIQWLITAKGFNPQGAPKAISSFIETMVFVAGETGKPQFQQTPGV
jgi:hypothetical protein